MDSPQIAAVRSLAKTRIFEIESIDLNFSNGEKRVYERFKSQGYYRGAVLIVPITANNELILVKEYAVGVERYELTFPKGIIDEGEEPAATAQRELQEEAGFAARRVDFLKTLAISPAYMCNTLEIYLARDLYPQSLPGDEPEFLEVIYWPFESYHELLQQENFSGSLSTAALFLAKEFLNDKTA